MLSVSIYQCRVYIFKRKIFHFFFISALSGFGIAFLSSVIWHLASTIFVMYSAYIFYSILFYSIQGATATLMADPEMHTSQNGFCFCKQSLHKKTNIIQNITKNIKSFIIEQSWKKIIIWDICWNIHTILGCSHCKSRTIKAMKIQLWQFLVCCDTML